ncbi:hypothetical protein MAR_005999 [Mya arenaria]|uniref:Uncharacterized protein n=1 Tax=Mya arenaria TaxID=6604 RepID=A0ABY7D8C1_MYAAR|nr:hypothetical protein MAR_005999 [Mya arenaria]
MYINYAFSEAAIISFISYIHYIHNILSHISFIYEHRMKFILQKNRNMAGAASASVYNSSDEEYKQETEGLRKDIKSIKRQLSDAKKEKERAQQQEEEERKKRLEAEDKLNKLKVKYQVLQSTKNVQEKKAKDSDNTAN